jgi:non-specific serine/threonine protein kinase
LEAAEVVCGKVTANVLEGLASLVDKSLLRQEVGPGRESRYLMLETLREYGLEQLRASGETGEALIAHATYYLTLAEGAEPELERPSQVTWLDRLEVEHNNLRAVLAWACAEGEAELGLRLAGSLWRFWMVRGHVAEGRAWLEATLALPSDSPHTATRAKALARVADLVRRCGDEALARAYSQESLAIWRELGDRAAAASELTHLGRMALAAGELAEARAALEEALAVERELGEQGRSAHSLLCLGRVAYFDGDLTEARHLTEESLALHRALGDSIGTVWALQSLAHTAVAEGAHAAARAAIAEGIAAARAAGYAWGLTVMLEAAATLAAAEGRSRHAWRLAAAAGALREPLGSSLAPDWRTDLDHLLAPARRLLSPAAATAAWAEGRGWSQERALVEALTPIASSASPSLPTAPGTGLTRREREVLRLLAEGQSNREIASALSISVLTTKTHVERILAKLGLHTRSAAAAYAHLHELA